ncbi:hypothetical protein [Ekhidna sp.]|uniref:hypothetical protein n=1 Tax=Ekhidna sp. TaxID=2608089 RepID=UPI003298F0DA
MMQSSIQQKLSHKLVFPVTILIFLFLLNLEFYWYVLAIAVLTLWVLLTHKQIEFDDKNVYFNKKFNPLSKKRFLEIQEIQHAIFVDRSEATGVSTYHHSYIRLFTTNNKHVDYRIALSEQSIRELIRILKKLNIQTQVTTEDPDKDKLL